MKKILIGLAIAVLLTLGLVLPVMGVGYQDVSVTTTPSFISIANTPGAWTVNGVNGDSTIEINTTYYACSAALSDDVTAPGATVIDNDCLFTLTDTSNVKVDVVVTMAHFAGGSDPMNNSDAGTNGVGTYGSYSYYSGMAYANKKIVKTSGSDVMYTSTVAGDADWKWATSLKTQTDDWTGGTSSTATLTITATKD